jgi:hypothetical protein
MNRAKQQKKSKIIPIVGTEKKRIRFPRFLFLLAERRKSGDRADLANGCCPLYAGFWHASSGF